MPRVLRPFLLLVLLQFIVATAAGQECLLPEVGEAADVVFALEDLRLDGCLDEQHCNDEQSFDAFLADACERVGAWEDEIAAALALSGEARQERLHELFGRVPRLVAFLHQTALALEPTAGRDALTARLDAWRRALDLEDPKAVEEQVAESPAAIWQPAGLAVFPRLPDEVDFADEATHSCQTPAGCREALVGATRVFTLAVLQRRLLEGVLESHLRSFVGYVEQVDRRWESYFADARGFYPWEELLNGELHRRRVGERGIVPPPDCQVLLLHPGVALVYRDDAADRLDEALTLELIGFYRWNWVDDRIARPWGASLATSWSGARGEDPGLGLLIHLPFGWSLGASWADTPGDDLTFLVSADLAKALDRGRTLRDRLKRTASDE